MPDFAKMRQNEKVGKLDFDVRNLNSELDTLNLRLELFAVW